MKPLLPFLACLALCGCEHHHDFTDQDYMRIERATVGDHVWEPRTEGEQLIVRACRKCGVLRLETKTSWGRGEHRIANSNELVMGDMTLTNSVDVFVIGDTNLLNQPRTNGNIKP